MENIDVRSYIINNFKDSNTKDIEESINSSIEDNDEITLPGLGVFFEIYWKNINQDEKNKVLEIIHNNL